MRRFAFGLAARLGMTVGDLLGRISSRELAEWQVLARIEAEEDRRRGMETRARARAAGVKRRRKGRR